MPDNIKNGMIHTFNEPPMGRDYYCSMKFRYIKIDLESQTSYTCHAAKPHRINFDWLEKNPGNLFNHDVNIQERQMMLRNERAPSCEQNCWRAEDAAQVSPRLYQKGHRRTHESVITKPEILEITIGADCNLTCSYCCKEYSSSWRRDLLEQGEYDLDGVTDLRYQLTDYDRLLMKISQPKLMKSPRYNILLEEIKQISPGLSRIDITGGEPFLNNKIVDLLENIETKDQTIINIYTGLGVDHARFNQILDRLCKNKKINLTVSNEGIGKYLEFNRYGITWSRFEKNLASILDRDIQFKFHCTLTNLTAFGFKEFYDYYCMHDIVLTFAYTPMMQTMNVMDQDSKVRLMKSFSMMPDRYREPLEKTMTPAPTELQRKNMAKFLTTFVKRRSDIDLSIYPSSFIAWLGIDHVV